MNIIDQLLRVAAGEIIVRDHVDESTGYERMEICKQCDKADLKNDKCLECGCFLSIKTNAHSNWKPSKNRIEITHCPLGKWGDIEIANAYREIDGLPILNQQ